MKAKKYTAGMLVLSGALLLAACGKQPAAPDKVYVGVASYDGGDVFIGELIDCLKEQLNGFSGEGIETSVTVRDAAGYQRTKIDQVKALNEAGVHAAYINSALTERQITKALELAAAGRYKMIYVAPER